MQDVDGRVVALRRQLARQNDVAVQNGAHRVADGLVEIVALHQHREEAGNGAAAEIAGALQHLGQQVETPKACSLSGWAARPRPGRSRAAPWPAASPNPSPAARWRPGRGSTRPPPAPQNRRGRAAARDAREVAHTTTERLRPSGPSSFSRKPRTSRLRSPIIPITVTSAELWRDMEPSSVLLPTPLPPKIPMRCPLPQGSRLSMARIPVTSGSGDVLAVQRIAGLAAQL